MKHNNNVVLLYSFFIFTTVCAQEETITFELKHNKRISVTPSTAQHFLLLQNLIDDKAQNEKEVIPLKTHPLCKKSILIR